MNKKVLLLLCFLLLPVQNSNAENTVAHVVQVHGKAQLIPIKINALSTELKQGSELFEGGVVQTSAESTLKLLLIDQSVLVLGPASQLKLDDIKKQNPAKLTLVEGRLRVQVMKNTLEKSDLSSQIKFFVKTKSAVMGVRGTDFEIIYNEQNQVSSLITFDGAVAMFKVSDKIENQLSTNRWPNSNAHLQNLLLSSNAVVVTEGRFSTVNPQMPHVSLPTKLSPAQFESLKNTGHSSLSSAGVPTMVSKHSSSQALSPIPPGADPKSFASRPSSLDHNLSSTLGSQPAAAMLNAVRGATAEAQLALDRLQPGPLPPPEGIADTKRGLFAPPAGGFLDLKSALYVPPPAGSSFDPKTHVFVPPLVMGSIDLKTGSYVPPKGFILDPSHGFVQSSVDSNKPGDAASAHLTGGTTLPLGSPPAALNPLVIAPPMNAGFSSVGESNPALGSVTGPLSPAIIQNLLLAMPGVQQGNPVPGGNAAPSITGINQVGVNQASKNSPKNGLTVVQQAPALITSGAVGGTTTNSGITTTNSGTTTTNSGTTTTNSGTTTTNSGTTTTNSGTTTTNSGTTTTNSGTTKNSGATTGVSNKPYTAEHRQR